MNSRYAASPIDDQPPSFFSTDVPIDISTVAVGSFGAARQALYLVNAVVATASGPAVSLANPWGFDQPSLIPLSKLSSVFAEMDVGRTV